MNQQKITGSYYTPDFLATFIVEYILPSLNINDALSILEPSVGDGAFIKAFNTLDFSEFSKINFTVVEKDIIELNKARVIASQNANPKIKFTYRGENFLDWQAKSTSKYSLIVGNPPYIKKNYIHEDYLKICTDIQYSAGLINESIKNIWSVFLIRSIQLLNDNGILAFVLPAELLQSNFTNSIRDLLVKVFERVEIFTFNDLLFDSIGQDTVVLVGYKKAKLKGTYYTNIENLDQLKDRSFKLSKNDMVQKTGTKWTHHILDEDEIILLNNLKNRFKPISNYCYSKPGIVTAANKFFIINAETENTFDLSEYTNPIIQKGFFVNGKVVFDKGDLDELTSSKRPSKFLNFSSMKNTALPINVSQYLELGIAEDIPSRYKCLKRDKWYVVPNIPSSSEGFFFKRSHNYPKLLKNEANVLVTDSAYQINMIEGYNISDLIFSFYNSLTLAFSELEGRYYGGGVLELTPKEFKSLPIPFTNISSSIFENFKKTFKNKTNIEEILVANDQFILSKIYGIDNETIQKLQLIKKKLTKKRLRK